METKKMDSQEEKDNKKITHSSSTNSSHSASQNICCWGAVAGSLKKISSHSDSPNALQFYLLTSAPLFASSVLWDAPWAHPLSVHLGVSLGHILSLQLKTLAGHNLHGWITKACQKRQFKKTSIASWGKYHALKKIVTKYLARKQAFRRFSNVVFGKQCWHGVREHAVPGLWCVLYFPQGRAVLGSVLRQAFHIRCCSAVLSGLQSVGSIFLWFTGMKIALPPLSHFTFFAMLLVSGLGDESKVRDTVQAALCSSEMFFLPKLYAHSEPVFNSSQTEYFKPLQIYLNSN